MQWPYVRTGPTLGSTLLWRVVCTTSHFAESCVYRRQRPTQSAAAEGAFLSQQRFQARTLPVLTATRGPPAVDLRLLAQGAIDARGE